MRRKSKADQTRGRPDAGAADRARTEKRGTQSISELLAGYETAASVHSDWQRALTRAKASGEQPSPYLLAEERNAHRRMDRARQKLEEAKAAAAERRAARAANSLSRASAENEPARRLPREDHSV